MNEQARLIFEHKLTKLYFQIQQCFEYPDYFRIVLTVPKEELIIALDRIMEYCDDHYVERKITTHSIVHVGGEQVQIEHGIPNYRQTGGLAKT